MVLKMISITGTIALKIIRRGNDSPTSLTGIKAKRLIVLWLSQAKSLHQDRKHHYVLVSAPIPTSGHLNVEILSLSGRRLHRLRVQANSNCLRDRNMSTRSRACRLGAACSWLG
eukprot:g34206.t1